ncbi:hypothetical protein [Halorientalis halophila]|uniref:hypothetical protein n=1 Tax=Halorientalis halophila TaxID=3108499 RepID=UPI0030087688
MGLLADSTVSSDSGPNSMTTEFDLPCADCGQELVRRQIDRAGTTVTVAVCQNCGGRYYPESALENS